MAENAARTTERVDALPTLPQCVADRSDGTRCLQVPKAGSDMCGIHASQRDAAAYRALVASGGQH